MQFFQETPPLKIADYYPRRMLRATETDQSLRTIVVWKELLNPEYVSKINFLSCKAFSYRPIISEYPRVFEASDRISCMNIWVLRALPPAQSMGATMQGLASFNLTEAASESSRHRSYQTDKLFMSAPTPNSHFKDFKSWLHGLGWCLDGDISEVYWSFNHVRF